MCVNIYYCSVVFDKMVELQTADGQDAIAKLYILMWFGAGRHLCMSMPMNPIVCSQKGASHQHRRRRHTTKRYPDVTKAT